MIIIIQNIYETHLHVRNLEKAINFYQNKLGLTLARKLSKRRVAFFWVGENKQQMLGLWEVHNIEDFEPRHFAFGVNLEFLMTSKAWLEERGIARKRKSRANCPKVDACCKCILSRW